MEYNPEAFDFVLEIQRNNVPIPKSPRWLIQGFATTTDIATDNTIIVKEALESAADDLVRRSTVLYNHDMDHPIGHIYDSDVRRTADNAWGLYVKAEISKTEPSIWEKIKENVLNKFSIRGRILESYEEWSEEAKINIRYITALEILEVSVVSVPALAQAQILEVAERSAGKVLETKKEEIMAGNPEEKKPEVVAEAKPEAKAEVKTEAKPEAKAEVKTEAKPEAKVEVKTEAKVEEKAEVKTEAKVEAKPEVKEEVRADGDKMDKVLGILNGLVESLKGSKQSENTDTAKMAETKLADETEMMKKLNGIEAMLKGLITSLQEGKYPLPAKRSEEEAKLFTNLTAEVTTIRSALENSQVLKPVPKKDEVKRTLQDITETEEYKKMDPGQKVRFLGGLLEKQLNG